jgi:hypothetical protein
MSALAIDLSPSRADVGNPRSNQFSGKGTPEAVFGGPIYGRSVHLVAPRIF